MIVADPTPEDGFGQMIVSSVLLLNLPFQPDNRSEDEKQLTF